MSSWLGDSVTWITEKTFASREENRVCRRASGLILALVAETLSVMFKFSEIDVKTAHVINYHG